MRICVISNCLSFQLQLTKTRGMDMKQENVNINSDGGVPFLVIPLIHELTANTTQLAEKRAIGPRKYLRVFFLWITN